MKKFIAPFIFFLIVNCGSTNKVVHETTTNVQTNKSVFKALKEKLRKNPTCTSTAPHSSFHSGNTH